MAQNGPKMAPKRPKSSKNRPKTENFQTFPNGPKWSPMASKWSKMAPKRILWPVGPVFYGISAGSPSLLGVPGSKRPQNGPKWTKYYRTEDRDGGAQRSLRFAAFTMIN